MHEVSYICVIFVMLYLCISIIIFTYYYLINIIEIIEIVSFAIDSKAQK